MIWTIFELNEADLVELMVINRMKLETLKNEIE